MSVKNLKSNSIKNIKNNNILKGLNFYKQIKLSPKMTNQNNINFN